MRPIANATGTLRLVEPAALSPVWFPRVWSSNIHLPGALRSPGITRLPRYYGSSVSCPAALRIRTRGRWTPSGSRQVSLFYAVESSAHSVSTHLPSSCDLGLVAHRRLTARYGAVPFASLPGPQRHLGFALWQQARHDDRPNRVRFLRTGRSPPIALHLPSRARSYVRLQSSNATLAGTCALLIQHADRRTATGSASVRCVGRLEFRRGRSLW